MALVTISGRLATMSVMLRLNQPSSPSPVVTPVASRPASEEKPDLYCVMANMSSFKCAAGCANLNDSLLVCGECFDRLILPHFSITFQLQSAMTACTKCVT
jgi:influenza virus NS1A-binding protein